MDNHIYLKNQIEEMIPTLSGACYVVRSLGLISNFNTLKFNLICILSFYFKIWNNFWG